MFMTCFTVDSYEFAFQCHRIYTHVRPNRALLWMNSIASSFSRSISQLPWPLVDLHLGDVDGGSVFLFTRPSSDNWLSSSSVMIMSFNSACHQIGTMHSCRKGS